jgi:hypothetical protein
MSRHRRPLVTLAVLGVAALALTACATNAAPDAPPGQSLGSLSPALPEGDVIAQGTVMDVAGVVELCLGAIAESYPPQCSGIPIENWTWDDVEGSETSGDVRWGAYAVRGTYDGETFGVTQPPIMLALYDPMMTPDPTGGVPGDTDEATLLEIQEELPALLGESYLSSGPMDGRLWVDVVWDDGTWQDAADDDYGKDVVIIRSALRDLEG